MSDRVIVAVKFTPAGPAGKVEKAVGGFLRYVQHRDVHPTQADGRPRPQVSGLLKYVAYRDQPNTRAELFGPEGPLNSAERKAFAGFVAESLDKSRPQLFRGRDGQPRDRRRAVYRLVISPERAKGLDLRLLTTAAINRLESESGAGGLRWIAAIHRNTPHHHIHLVVAGMYQDAEGAYHRLDLTKLRLAAIKEELTHEIQRQRLERSPAPAVLPASVEAKAASTRVAALVVGRPSRVGATPPRGLQSSVYRPALANGSLMRLRVVARRYQRRMQRELDDAYRQSQLEHAA